MLTFSILLSLIFIVFPFIEIRKATKNHKIQKKSINDIIKKFNDNQEQLKKLKLEISENLKVPKI